jgi:Raf kinase inhibitor-like YbhB/YbcL family protein
MVKKIMMMFMLFTALPVSTSVSAAGLYLQSSDIKGQLDDAQVFNSFGCSGKNISPQLSWGNAPEATKSFAVTVYDPDAPTGSGWWHWVVFNIPKSVSGLPAGASGKVTGKDAMPAGAVESYTSYNSKGFGGACPPPGDKPHRYIFTVYALDTDKIEQGSDARPELVGFYINTHAIAKASIMAYYGR